MQLSASGDAAKSIAVNIASSYLECCRADRHSPTSRYFHSCKQSEAEDSVEL